MPRVLWCRSIYIYVCIPSSSVQWKLVTNLSGSRAATLSHMGVAMRAEFKFIDWLPSKCNFKIPRVPSFSPKWKNATDGPLAFFFCPPAPIILDWNGKVGRNEEEPKDIKKYQFNIADLRLSLCTICAYHKSPPDIYWGAMPGKEPCTSSCVIPRREMMILVFKSLFPTCTFEHLKRHVVVLFTATSSLW